MSVFNKPKLSEPNSLGYQFGIADDLTKYAHDKQYQWGNSYLPGIDITVLEVWKNDNREAWLLIDEKTNQTLEESFNYEDCCCKIDAFKILKQGEKYE